MTNKEKVIWLRQNILGIEKINPYKDTKALLRIKNELIKIGAYKDANSDTTHQAVINLIMKVRGKYGKVHNASSKQNRKTECYY